jgi:superfamily II DNA helicase RecQ
LEQIPDLDPLSKSEVTKESSSLLKKVILKIFKKNESNSYIHKELLDITKDFKYGKEINLLLNKVKGFYSSPIVQICHLALSFLNLVNSIKTFKENKQDFKIFGKQFSRELSNICSDFEEHKREIGLLNLSKIRESTQRIREVHEKILSDKNRLSNLIERIRKKISEKESEKKKGGVAIALGCLGVLSSIIGAVFTGGASLIIYTGAAVLNGAAIGIHSANIIEINENIEVYNNMLIKGIDKEKEINILLDKIRIEYNI